MRLQATGFCKIASASNYVATRERALDFCTNSSAPTLPLVLVVFRKGVRVGVKRCTVPEILEGKGIRI